MSTEETKNESLNNETPIQKQVQQPKTTGKKQATTKPEIASKPIAKQGVRFVIVSMGQGGARIGATLAASLPNHPIMIAVNTSDQDLKQVNIPEEFKFKIGGDNADGAGKNRNKAKAYFKNFAATNIYNNETLDALTTFLGYYEEVLFHPTQQTIIITTFSADGGTGSGLGPLMTASLSSYMNSCKSFRIGKTEYNIDDTLNEIPKPVVIGLTSRCALDAGATNLQNTVECFSDIQTFVNKGLGNYFIADNNLPSDVVYNNTDEMYRIINARIVAPFVKFFGIEMNSDIKCLDLQDKINTLRIPGCSSFASITKENQFAYAVPRGQSVTRTIIMLRHDVENLSNEEANAKNMLKANDVMSVDTTSVYFEIDKSGIVADKVEMDLIGASMIGFFGYRSLNVIVEDLKDNLHRIIHANDKKFNVIQENSNGFASVKADSAELNDRFSAKTIDQSSLMDLV